jgi:two-component system sensor histidine kinase/response regulator
MKELSNPLVTFLLVDDRPENLLVLEALLRRDGLEIVTAQSGKEALEILLSRDIGLAIIDVQMPEMSGFELAELMRGMERSKHIPIIFVTAGIQDSARIFEGYDAGAVDFLHKPIEPRFLRNKAETFFQLCKQRLELAATLRFQETFVATLGHDLKSPLNSIAMATQLLSRGLREKDQVDLATRILAATRRMTVMIDQLYDLSRSRVGDGIPVELHPVDLSVTVRRAIEEHRITSSSPIELREKGQGIVCCDEPRIMQVMSNLLGNALKHGMAGTPVTVTLNNDEPDVSISVHNAGSIPSGVQDHLFDPFISYGDRRHLREGLGLGLYIVDQIVRAHGGQVHVRSNEKDGTTFMIRVPRGGASSAPGVG